MLYELIGIARPGNLAEVKEIVTAAGNVILQNRGVIRGISNWGVFSLPRPVSAHQMRHRQGHYFAVRFDASTAAQEAVRDILRQDPRIIRYSSVKLGDGKLGSLARFGGSGANGPEGW